ncbi:MAG: LTA synthase family protein [Gemmatimonadota bacterium]
MTELPGGSTDGRRRRRAWIRPFVPLFALLVVLLLVRVLLLALYPADFESLSPGQAAGAFLNGLRFDLSISLQLVGLPLLLTVLPLPFARRRWWQKVWGWPAFFLVAAGWLLAIADLVYFPDVHRHIGSDLANSWGSDWDTLVKSLFDFPIPLLVFVVVLALIGRVWGKALNRPPAELAAARNSWIAYAVLVALVGFGFWGGVGQRIGVIDAFRSGSAAAGYLTMNGPFSALRSMENATPRSFEADLDTSIADVRSRFVLSGESWDSDDRPLQRTATPPLRRPGARPPNVVVLVLESWDAIVTDALRASAGLDTLGATPVFDALVSDGVLFSRFYSAGQRSLEGLIAMLASYPTLPGIPYLGDATAGIELSFLGRLAKEQGYATHMVRSASKESFNLGSVAELAGFDTYSGAEDIVGGESHTHVPAGKWGAWDFDSLSYLNELLAAEDDPFVAFFFGSSSHTPFLSPGDRWARFPTDTEIGRFHNAVHYVDWSVGRFLSLAKQAGYYDNTIWVITADQGSRMIDAPMSPDRFWIPALIFGPGVPSGRVDDQIASHLDILPTIIDLAGWPVSHSSFGESLFHDREERALLKAGDLVMRIGESGWLLHSLRERVGGVGSTEDLAILENRLLAEAQVLTELFHSNRVFRAP